jgi:hypothetical protein
MLELYLGSVLNHVQSVCAQLVVEVCYDYHPCCSTLVALVNQLDMPRMMLYQLLNCVSSVPLWLSRHVNRMDEFSSYQQAPSIHLLPCMLAPLTQRYLPVYNVIVRYCIQEVHTHAHVYIYMLVMSCVPIIECQLYVSVMNRVVISTSLYYIDILNELCDCCYLLS